MIGSAFYDRFIFWLFVQNSLMRNLLILATVTVWGHKSLLVVHVDAKTETGLHFSPTNWSRRGTRWWTYLGVDFFLPKITVKIDPVEPGRILSTWLNFIFILHRGRKLRTWTTLDWKGLNLIIRIKNKILSPYFLCKKFLCH